MTRVRSAILLVWFNSGLDRQSVLLPCNGAGNSLLTRINALLHCTENYLTYIGGAAIF